MTEKQAPPKRFCFCIPLGVMMYVAFFFALTELGWTCVVGRKIYKDIDHSWALICVVTIGVKLAPVITFVNMAYNKETVFAREAHHSVFLTTQIIEALTYGVLLVFTGLWKTHPELFKIWAIVYLSLLPFKIIFLWCSQKYWLRLVHITRINAALLKGYDSVIF